MIFIICKVFLPNDDFHGTDYCYLYLTAGISLKRFKNQPKTPRYRWYKSPLVQVFRKPKLFNINRKQRATAGTGLTAGDAKYRGFNGNLSTVDNSMTYDRNERLCQRETVEVVTKCGKTRHFFSTKKKGEGAEDTKPKR